MLIKPLADKTKLLKETPEGVATMCKAIEENNKRIFKNNNLEIAISLLRIGKLSNDEIAKATKLTIEELAKTINHIA